MTRERCTPSFALMRLRRGLLTLTLFALLVAHALAGDAPLHATAASSAPAPERWSQLADTVFTQLTQDQGLPNQVVSSIAEDGNGFMWFGTVGGLARWDGYRFRTFLTDPKDPGALPSNLIHTLYADSRGRLWIGTAADGLSRYDPTRDRFINTPAGPNGLSSARVFSISEDGKGGVWVGTEGGLDHLDPDTGAITHLRHDPQDARSLPDNRVNAVLRARDGTLWVGTTKGLSRLASNGHTFVAVALLVTDEKPHAVHCLYQASDGHIWVGTTRNGAFVVDPATGHSQPVTEIRAIDPASINPGSIAPASIGPEQIHAHRPGQSPSHLPPDRVQGSASPAAAGEGDRTARKPVEGQIHEEAALNTQWVQTIAEVRPGLVWLGTYGQGIVEIDTGTGQTRRLRHDPMLATSLAEDTVSILHRDHAGLVWVGTNRGLSRHDASQSAVLTVFGASGGSTGIADADVHSVLATADGRVWLGLHSSGVDVLDPAGLRVRAFRPDEANPATALPQAIVLALAQSNNGDVLIGTERGLYRAASGSDQLSPITWADRGPSRISALAADGAQLWVGGIDGVWRLDPGSNGTGVNVTGVHAIEPAKLTDPSINAIASGPGGAWWIGTRNGLNRLDPTSGKVERILPRPAVADGLVAGFITSLLIDRQGRLWVGALGGGVNILVARDASGRARFKRLGTAQGLPSMNVDQLLADRAGQVWASTSDGLAVIDPTTFAVRALRRADGVAIRSYWTHSGATTPQGELLFGGLGGLTVVKPQRLSSWNYRPPLVVTDARVGGKPVSASRFNGADNAAPLTIPSDANSLAVEFAALGYSAPELNQYAYQLQGYDHSWITTDATRRLAAYTNLPPGDYRLRLRGSNRAGVWVEKELIVPIRVLPAWYQTAWFRCVLLLLVLAGIYGVVRWRTTTLKQRQRELEAEVEARTADLTVANSELQKSYKHLEETQAQLVQAEKMASLGQLVANVAHEINTPIGAVKSSGATIAESLDGVLTNLPKLFQILNADGQDAFLALISHARVNRPVLDSREERFATRETALLLEEAGIDGASAKAGILVELGAQASIGQVLPLLRHAQSRLILATAYNVVTILTNTDNINAAVDQVSKIVRALKSFSRVDQGGEMTLADLREGIDMVLVIYRSQIRQGIKLVCRYEDIPPVRCLPDELNQVWTNLIHNALQAMSYNGTLTIAIRRTEREAVVSFADTGCGIPNAIRDRIFDAFFTTKPVGEGSGLGLNIVSKIIDKHQGRIEVESEVGVGTTFSVYLPLG
jgi:signal transduction histidine kinase/sugar lactone lactonase YvrE